MATELGQPTALADQRKAKGISLWTIECSTKISPRFLEAIEAEDFDALPGGVYAINYLRQYARVVGIDEAELLGRYYDKTQPKASTPPPAAGGRLTRWLREWPLSRHFFADKTTAAAGTEVSAMGTLTSGNHLRCDG